MQKEKTLLIIPANDPEAGMIIKLAQAMGLSMKVLQQPHGASLDLEKNLVQEIKEGKWKEVVIVETPGPDTEKKIEDTGVSVHLIDHHHYTGLDRAHDPKTGAFLPSSLEQFLSLFRFSDTRLHKLGFEPKIVRGIGIMDRGYIWALQNEGYSRREIKKVVALSVELMKEMGKYDEKKEERREEVAKKVWEKRVAWKEFFVVRHASDLSVRSSLSLVIALECKKRVPLILWEPKRGGGVIYVQESPHGMTLFEAFGGFTFGMDKNWGYKNEKGKKRIGLQEVKHLLQKQKTG